MRRDSQRAAWTAFVEGKEATKASKYGNERTRGYASKREADYAVKMQALASRGLIKDYEEQKRITLVPGNGKLRPIVYVADFYYVDDLGTPHVLDAKGFKTAVYRLKKRMAALLLHIEIEEV